jgi:hypothetical protein
MQMNLSKRSVMLLLALSSIPLAAQPATGYLKTSVNPGRAGVFIDGKYVGPAANFRVGRKYPVSPGEHEIRLEEPRYEDVVTKVTIRPGKTTTVAETMKARPLAKPPFGLLRTMSTDKFAPVYINGHFMGHAGEFNNSVQGLRLNPGSYLVRIGEGREETVKIETEKVAICGSRK